MASPGGRHGAPQLWLQAMQAAISPAPAPAPAINDGCYMVRRWIDWEIQTLVLVSFLLQVLLFMFANMRRRKISNSAKTVIWLAYQLADSVAIYVLGHMTFFGKSPGHKQLMAFWAPFLLVHLGGQDNITAYSIEDNQLWQRHMLSFVLQTGGVAYVLGKNVAGSRTLVIAAVLMFVSGVLKYGERVWALKSSSLDNMSKFLDKRRSSKAKREQWARRDVQGRKLDPEEVLHGAHVLLPICMAQFVDYKFWPSELESADIVVFKNKGQMFELVEMQLSLMYDFLYTKAVVIATWHGCFIRVISSIASIITFLLFLLSTGKKDFEIVDIIVTYILTLGAVILELIAFSNAMRSTWTCELLHARRRYGSHKTVVNVRRYFKFTDRNRRWSGSIGHPDRLNSSHGSGGSAQSLGCKDLWKKPHYSFHVISDGTKGLVLDVVQRIVEACEGKEDVMRSYSSQCALKAWSGFFNDPTSHAGIDFDDKMLSWYFATKSSLQLWSHVDDPGGIVEAIVEVSNYMIFLLVEHPYMLPSPARPGSYANIEETCVGVGLDFSDTECIKRKLGLSRRSRMCDLDTRELTELQITRGKLDIIRNDLGRLREDQDKSLDDLCRKWYRRQERDRYSFNPVGRYGTKEDAQSIEELSKSWKKLNQTRGELYDLMFEVGNKGKKLEVLDEIKKDLEQDVELYRLEPGLRRMVGRRSSKVDGGREENLQLDPDLDSLRREQQELSTRRTEVCGTQEESDIHLDVLNKTMEKLEELDRRIMELHLGPSPPLVRAAELAFWLLEAAKPKGGEQEVGRVEEVRRVLLGVWVEMLCYAAHHCSRDSHARQLNSGGEFITVVWFLSTAVFNASYCNEAWFKNGAREFFRPPIHFKEKKKDGWFHRFLVSCGFSPHLWQGSQVGRFGRRRLRF